MLGDADTVTGTVSPPHRASVEPQRATQQHSTTAHTAATYTQPRVEGPAGLPARTHARTRVTKQPRTHADEADEAPRVVTPRREVGVSHL